MRGVKLMKEVLLVIFFISFGFTINELLCFTENKTMSTLRNILLILSMIIVIFGLIFFIFYIVSYELFFNVFIPWILKRLEGVF